MWWSRTSPTPKSSPPDYIMANPFAAEILRIAPTEFADDDDPFEFPALGDRRLLRQGRLQDQALQPGIRPAHRHPRQPEARHSPTLVSSTPTSSCTAIPPRRRTAIRARARWTYYHFLGPRRGEIRLPHDRPNRSRRHQQPHHAQRRLHRLPCRARPPWPARSRTTATRAITGRTTAAWDSLDPFYKEPPDGSESLYVEGDTWYRDMRLPGFHGQVVPDADYSLPWLAQQIAADERFAAATVRFWWPAVMGVDIADVPEDPNDPGFAGRLLAANAQAQELSRIAERFRNGIGGTRPLQLEEPLARHGAFGMVPRRHHQRRRPHPPRGVAPCRRRAPADAGRTHPQDRRHHRRRMGPHPPPTPPAASPSARATSNGNTAWRTAASTPTASPNAPWR